MVPTPAALDEPLYLESLSSRQTSLLFQSLAVLFFALAVHRFSARGLDALSIVYAFFLLVFLFYTLNYRTLHIRVTRQALTLRFGLISWQVDLDNIGRCALDELPGFLQYGGAGVHFMVARGRYRVSFNFLEYPRVVLALRRKRGPVRDVSFSTRCPDAVLQTLAACGPSDQVSPE